jgi:hypothetical protein
VYVEGNAAGGEAPTKAEAAGWPEAAEALDASASISAFTCKAYSMSRSSCKKTTKVIRRVSVALYINMLCCTYLFVSLEFFRLPRLKLLPHQSLSVAQIVAALENSRQARLLQRQLSFD